MRESIYDYIASLDLPNARIEKTFISFEEHKMLLFNGVFCSVESPHFITNGYFRCARERLQTGTAMTLLIFTAARPGELVVSQPYVNIAEDAVKWKDLVFYVRKIIKIVDGRESISYTIEIDFYIRNLKGMRRNSTQ